MNDEKDLGYEEYLNQMQKEPNEEELNNRERVLCKARVLKNFKKPLNNFNYKPFLEGS